MYKTTKDTIILERSYQNHFKMCTFIKVYFSEGKLSYKNLHIFNMYYMLYKCLGVSTHEIRLESIGGGCLFNFLATQS